MANELEEEIIMSDDEMTEEKKRLDTLELLRDYSGKDEIITSDEAWKRLANERKKGVTRFFSKIPTLDKLLDGFRPGDLIVVSAPTKMGKTTLCQSFTTALAEADVNCLWFSYEMRQQEFLEKFGESLPLFSLPATLAGNSLDWIESRIVESIAKHDSKVVFIDHLHFIVDLNFIAQRGNVSLLIGSIMRRLKQIALKWNIAIVIICHTTKIDFEKQPDLSDIRDSSFISQEADTTLMIWRVREKETGEFGNRAKLAVLANRRNGQTGKITLVLKDNRFYEEDSCYEGNN